MRNRGEAPSFTRHVGRNRRASDVRIRVFARRNVDAVSALVPVLHLAPWHVNQCDAQARARLFS
jgi:hypothetical protein